MSSFFTRIPIPPFNPWYGEERVLHRLQRSFMNAKPKREQPQAAQSSSQETQPLVPISSWTSIAIGITTYVFEESEAAIRQSGLVPEWVSYPAERPGNGIAVPANHAFP